MRIAQSRTRELYPLSRKKILKKTLVHTIAWIITITIISSIVIFFLMKVSNGHYVASTFLLSLFLLIFVVLPTYLYQVWYFNVYFYDLTPDFIVIKKGPITPREITIPYERIQDVYVDQDIFDRILGIYDVHLSSATISSGMEAHIDGVERQAADGLRAELLTIVSERISKNRVVSQAGVVQQPTQFQQPAPPPKPSYEARA